MDLGLKGLKAVLAGATRGIGRATAELLADEGCDIALCARNGEEVDEAVTTLSGKGIKTTGAAIDITDVDAYKAWVASAAEELGGCDIFISFASASGGAASEESWKANFELDLMGTVRGVEAALPHLKKSENAAIVAVATTAALEEFMGVQSYNSIKAAVINYASNLSQAMAADGIRVNTVSPGPIYIEGGPWNFIKDHMPDVYNSTLDNVPLGRLGSGDEVARTIAFLASPAAGFVTGTNLIVDGGITKRVQY